MSMRFTILACALAALLIAAVSCSGGGRIADTPTSPELMGAQAVEGNGAGHYLLAFAQIYVDPATDSVEVVPMRQVETHWNVLKFLEKGPCWTCIGIVGVTPMPDGTKQFTVEITHPFPGTNLTGFDVRGIAMFKGSRSYPASGLTTPDRALGDGELVNADGYTTLYNSTTMGAGPGGFQGYFKGKYTGPLVPDALLNGYKRHISAGGGNTRNAFFAGDSTMVFYQLDMPDTGFYFNYCVDASWAPPTTKPVTNPMTDFPPEANCPEPWKIAVTENPVDGGLHELGGETVLVIDVYDWQGKTSHAAPVVECPELFNDTVPATWVSDGTGFSEFEATITNSKHAGIGEYEVLISVVDNENATAPDWLDLTAYQIISVGVVAAGNQPPTAIAGISSKNAFTNQNINFFDKSTDPDGYEDIESWAWDLSYDEGDGFQTDRTDQYFVYQYTQAGVYLIQLRVTDSESHTDMLDEPETVTVTYKNQPPVATATVSPLSPPDGPGPGVGETVYFYDFSTDPDGPSDIVKWEWDFSYNSVAGFQVESTEPSPTHVYNATGYNEVFLRVTDTADNVDWLDWPLHVIVHD